jgi:hypothetical protein
MSRSGFLLRQQSRDGRSADAELASIAPAARVTASLSLERVWPESKKRNDIVGLAGVVGEKEE